MSLFVHPDPSPRMPISDDMGQGWGLTSGLRFDNDARVVAASCRQILKHGTHKQEGYISGCSSTSTAGTTRFRKPGEPFGRPERYLYACSMLMRCSKTVSVYSSSRLRAPAQRGFCSLHWLASLAALRCTNRTEYAAGRLLKLSILLFKPGSSNTDFTLTSH